ncbi:hypothetical protein SAMD00023353_0900780 [Rosellinia necatrix]|uniref:Uncharacterized protein n=1 Tax=Rosellinia necatrix TaxID=77044 RepID=A0A1S8A680_ROSNE|nr:hypothetical protein SAMD00023353_0900780 [Rosellinia necatrix]
MPFRTDKAKEKFKDGVEKTKASAHVGCSYGTQGDSMPGYKPDNPKEGWFTPNIAKGDTQSSNYNPGAFGGSSRG